jgi:hypothetical protein
VQLSGQVQPNLVEETRQMHPATHHFAGTPGIDNVAHFRESMMPKVQQVNGFLTAQQPLHVLSLHESLAGAGTGL